LYDETIERENIIKSLGYNLVVMWESEWNVTNGSQAAVLSWGGGISVHYGAFIVFYSRNIDIETDLGVWCVLFGRRHSVGGSSRCSRRLRRARRGEERRMTIV
jgi:hypothetical protein